MFPTVRAFGVAIPTYGVLYLTAFLVGLWLLGPLAKREGLDVYRIRMLGVYCVLVSRLSSVIIDAQITGAKLSLGLAQSTGAFFWALISGLAFVFGYSKHYGLPVLKVLDCFSPPLVLAQAIGRLGCFAAGCCFGKPTRCGLGVIYTDVHAHNISQVPLGVAIHPVQLYESATALLSLIWFLWLYPRRTFPGQIFVIMLGAVSAARIVIESFRGDTQRGFVASWLSLPRLIAAVLCFVAFILFFQLRRRELRADR